MRKSLLALAAAAATLTAIPTAPVLAQPAPSYDDRRDRDDRRGPDDRRRDDRRGPDGRRGPDDRPGPNGRGPGPGPGYGRPDGPRGGFDRPPPRRNIYDSRGRYLEPRPIGRNSRIWRGRDGRYYCRRDNGTTGLLIGAGVGALAGHKLAGSGDRTLGAILGGVIGGALGRSIDRGEIRCR